MKKLLPFLLLCGAGVGLYLFLKNRKTGTTAGATQANPKSLQANKPAPAIATTDAWMGNKGVVAGIVSALPTIVKGLAPGRWFNPDDTRQIYDENASGLNVSDNSENLDVLEGYDQGFNA